jgi:hypothetical protein
MRTYGTVAGGRQGSLPEVFVQTVPKPEFGPKDSNLHVRQGTANNTRTFLRGKLVEIVKFSSAK